MSVLTVPLLADAEGLLSVSFVGNFFLSLQSGYIRGMVRSIRETRILLGATPEELV